MSLKLAVRSDFPPKDGILTVSADTTLVAFREQASELLKIASSELAKYQLLAVAFGNDVRAIKADEKESLSAAGIKNQDVLIYTAYGEKRPKIKDKRKEEVESKEEAKQVKAAKYPGLSIKNALAKAQTLSGSKQEMAMEFIDIYLNKISATKEFLALKPEFLTTILKRNTLNIKEVDLFSAVLKWGQAECKRQDAEASPDKLKEVLADMLPLIRFPTMTSQDVALKVAPANLLSGPEILEIFNYLGLIQAGKDPEVSTLGRWITTARKGRRPPNWFVWSAAHKGPNVMLEEDGIIARHTNSSWSTVGGSELIESGVWEWEITLTNYNTSNSYNVAIGVVPENFSNWSLTSLFGYSGQPGWAFITGNGNVTSGSTSVRSYGNSFCATGDKVSVRVDKDANTIEFGVNGVWKGVAFSDVTGKVRPALGLVQNQTVTLGFPE